MTAYATTTAGSQRIVHIVAESDIEAICGRGVRGVSAWSDDSLAEIAAQMGATACFGCARGGSRIDPVVQALNEAWAENRDEPRHQVQTAGALITVTAALGRHQDGGLIVAAFESYTDPYMRRPQPASSIHILTADEEERLLERATTLFVRWPPDLGSGLRKGKAHG